MTKTADAAKMVIRLPQDVKLWLEQESAKNGASQNSEIIRSVRARMSDDQAQRK